MKEFIALTPKMCSYLTVDVKEHREMRLKRKIKFEEYQKCL